MSSKNDSNPLHMIYILGLSHSGSTLLDMLLSRHPDLVGLGEVNGLLVGKKRNFEGTVSTCSCGKQMNDCLFWKDLGDIDTEVGYKSNYRRVIERVRQYGARGFIDSSKDFRPLKNINSLSNNRSLDLSIVYLVRDARGWAHSMARIDRKQGRYRPMFYYLYLWYRGNAGFLRRLKKMKVTFLPVSYERLCFETDTVLCEVFSFSNIPYNELRSADTHIAYGNRMKLKVFGEPKVKYDDAWRKDWSTCLSLWLLPHIYLLNRKLIWNLNR